MKYGIGGTVVGAAWYSLAPASRPGPASAGAIRQGAIRMRRGT
jgi:hypothetical protein